ncbi:hypothetical protein Droror1_Dr00023480, partial [Drosera rotundifolia]
SWNGAGFEVWLWLSVSWNGAAFPSKPARLGSSEWSGVSSMTRVCRLITCF